MDTDSFSDMAYSIIVSAAKVSDTLKVELGAMSREYTSEDNWLNGVQEYCREIIEAPDDYVDAWNLAEEEGITGMQISNLAQELVKKAHEILLTPPDKRGTIEW